MGNDEELLAWAGCVNYGFCLALAQSWWMMSLLKWNQNFFERKEKHFSHLTEELSPRLTPQVLLSWCMLSTICKGWSCRLASAISLISGSTQWRAYPLWPYQSAWIAPLRLAGTQEASRATAPSADDGTTLLTPTLPLFTVLSHLRFWGLAF